nr:MAG TPA: hypothetical protein [Bacteriophage sp.]
MIFQIAETIENKRKTEKPLRLLGFLIWWSRGELNPCIFAYIC